MKVPTALFVFSGIMLSFSLWVVVTAAIRDGNFHGSLLRGQQPSIADDEMDASYSKNKIHHNHHDDDEDPTIHTTCNDRQDESSCLQTTDGITGQSCWWCICGAIPSECLTTKQSQLVPPEICDCRTPSILKLVEQIVTVDQERPHTTKTI